MSSIDRYILWNYILAEQCLLRDPYKGVVLLTVTPKVLATALEEAGEGACSPEEAEKDFIATVANVYRDYVLQGRSGLWALKSPNESDAPLCLGFLAFSVLAAFHMRTDENYTGKAYYPRLAEMLDCGRGRTYPAGFDRVVFGELWEDVAQWLEVHYGRRLAMPQVKGVRKYVAYPFSHVPLREVDIERLPQFFDAHGYEPGILAPLDRLAYDLHDGAGPWRNFTKAGREALRDPIRQPLVVQQVAHELERWDGCHTDSSGTRIATVEIWMDIRRRQAQLFLAPRRPQGFPELIENGELVFESDREGWYAPIPLGSSDASFLNDGIRIAARSSGSRYIIQFRQSDAIPLTPSEHAGFISDRVLRMSSRCAVLCRESIVGKVGHFLREVSQATVSPRRDGNLPSGWCLFLDICPTAIVEPPPGLERLRVESSIALVPRGGLRLRRRWSWLEGAAADVSVMGDYRRLVVQIDGQEVIPESDGRLCATLLNVRGSHEVEVGNRLRQRIEVRAGVVHPECKSWDCNDAVLEQIPLAIPEGAWVVVGAMPGERENVVAKPEGALVRPGFCAQWALKVGSGRGATAFHLHDSDASLNGNSNKGGKCSRFIPSQDPVWALSWAEAIYQTGVRKPLLVCHSNCQPKDLAAEWRRLKEKAQSIKRRMRKRR